MKKILIALTAILFFCFWQNEKKVDAARSNKVVTNIASANSNDKVTICHRTGNGSSHTITVSVNAVPAHLAHGDAIGDCNDGGGGGE